MVLPGDCSIPPDIIARGGEKGSFLGLFQFGTA